MDTRGKRTFFYLKLIGGVVTINRWSTWFSLWKTSIRSIFELNLSASGTRRISILSMNSREKQRSIFSQDSQLIRKQDSRARSKRSNKVKWSASWFIGGIFCSRSLRSPRSLCSCRCTLSAYTRRCIKSSENWNSTKLTWIQTRFLPLILPRWCV